jgi:hypothetical protein
VGEKLLDASSVSAPEAPLVSLAKGVIDVVIGIACAVSPVVSPLPVSAASRKYAASSTGLVATLGAVPVDVVSVEEIVSVSPSITVTAPCAVATKILSVV